jgi:hypothetical protein
MRRRLLTVAVSALSLALAGCASSAGGGAAGGDTASQAPGLPADLVVFQVETSGGFVPIDYALGTQPTLTIYGDGTVYAPIEEDTYHPVVALRRGSVDIDTLNELIDAASSSGVFDDVDFGMPGVTDLGTTTVSFRPQEGAPLTASAYALGFGDGEDASGLTEAQQNQRYKLSAMIGSLVQSVTYPADGGSWTPDRVEVTDLTDSPPGDEHTTEWPGPDLTALLTRNTATRPCGELSGADAATVFAAAREAKSSSWTAENETHHLVIRALLPGEAACKE